MPEQDPRIEVVAKALFGWRVAHADVGDKIIADHMEVARALLRALDADAFDVEEELRERMATIERIASFHAEEDCDCCEGAGIEHEGDEWAVCSCVLEPVRDERPDKTTRRVDEYIRSVEAEEAAIDAGVSTDPIPAEDLARAAEYVRERGWTGDVRDGEHAATSHIQDMSSSRSARMLHRLGSRHQWEAFENPAILTIGAKGDDDE
jgi:hypothetical protein